MTSENVSRASGSSNDKDMEFKSWVNSMHMMLGCVNNPTVEACSISVVPEQLGKSKVEAYTPRKVSIGPLHRGSSPDLIYMEDIKWRRMKHLLSQTEFPDKKLKVCSKAILDLDEILRASYYVNDIKLNSYDLSQILLLDGCFLLDLLISGTKQLNEREVVLSDLTVLGNQIPFVILSKLATLLFLPGKGFPNKEVETEIKKSVLSLLGYSSDSTLIDYHSFDPAHVLGLVHWFITTEAEKGYDENQKSPQYLSINVDGEDQMRQLKLKRCATKLEAAGVKIKAAEHEEIRFDLNIIFSNEKLLEIPTLHITETTEAKWRNFIAWELTRSPYSMTVGCKFVWYALFFQGLICSVHDIQLLRDRNVIVVHDAESSSLDSKGVKKKKIMSNGELLIFFRNILKGVRDDQIVKDCQFYKLFQELNSHPTPLDWVIKTSSIIWLFIRKVLTGIRDGCGKFLGYCIFRIEEILKKSFVCMIIWHFCRRVLTAIWYFCRNSYEILIRDHITTRWKLIIVVAAILTFALTFVKTFFPNLFH